MNTSLKTVQRSNAILWAVAIITSALIGNSDFLTIIILPVLALMSLSNTVYIKVTDE